MSHIANIYNPLGNWDSGVLALRAAQNAGEWADGHPLGGGHGQPYLKLKYASMLRSGSKTVEGRPNLGWVTAVSPGDWITFKISGTGGLKLVCKVDAVHTHETFSDMLTFHGHRKLLPDADTLEEAIEVYHSFCAHDGRTYRELQELHGATSLVITPLRNRRSARPRWRAGVLRT
jgi:ASC-1-like (ASCH) protein